MLDAAKALWKLLTKVGWVQTLLSNWMLFLPFSFILSLFALVMSKADTLHTKAQEFLAYLPGAGWSGYYAKVNVVIPLTESLGLLALLLGLKVGAMAVRFVKVLIPNFLTGS